MQFLSENPNKRNIMIIGALVCVAVIGLIVFFMLGGGGTDDVVVEEKKGDSELITGASDDRAIIKIQGNISALEEELKNEFYRSLVYYKITFDGTSPGKENPFEK